MKIIARWCALAAFAAAALGATAQAQASTSSSSRPWWKGAVIYEIYPRSFQDTDGDGIGDLNGITSRLDYLKSLGVDAIWLTPIYPSPQVDFGYDISNYEAIDPQYGTMKDFDHLVAEAKKRHIRVIMDLVLNHTSDKHPWFKESESSRNNPKRDWYIWRDGKGHGQPPNNWQSVFGHSAWQYDAKTKQWYYHKFYIQQPDLNWRNPAVRKAMYDVERFWIRHGVAGFRLDAITTLFEDPKLHDEGVLRDASGKPLINAFGDPRLDDTRTNNLPGVHDVLRKLRSIADSYRGRQIVLIGETYVSSVADLRKMYGLHNDELQLPMDLQVGFINKLDVDLFRRRITEAETGLDGDEPLLVLDNHDNPRWDRYGDGVHNLDIGRVLATVVLASRGSAMYYYGDEIGMVTTPPTRKEDVRDPVGITGWPKEKGRDGERTPMQWTAGPDAGFGSAGVKTWLPIPPSYTTANVAVESAQPDSLLSWYKELDRLKHVDAALREGRQVMLNTTDSNVLSWLRQAPDGEAVVVTCNFTKEPQKVSFDLKALGVAGNSVETLMMTPGAVAPKSLEGVELPPFGVYIGRVK
ncbi:MAG: alpha-glucosidase [Alphaproteobacteria bacterium]|nr:alpha-glucosidase [Alphaproteobacteria bacterium]MDE2111845.1 alpha-glucosidase [Alphaproteobacteria bacterium]MDE2493585.1 alpha-glucosidase [Alphaproteobacteria bacterium]